MPLDQSRGDSEEDLSQSDATPPARRMPDPKPVIIAVDDDPAVLDALSRDLSERYADVYRIVGAGSGEDALRTTQGLEPGADVALFIADQRMPEMTGIEFIIEAKALHPAAKKVLLTAYADTEAAIRAINEAALDFYLMKPWDPAEENLYPILDDLLDDWHGSTSEASHDVFLSYDSRDSTAAEALAHRLEDTSKLRVWWDRRIPPGERFADVIETALDAASCVVVLWTQHSVSSEWVQIEADSGADRNILVPVFLEDVRPPLRFRGIEGARLINDDPAEWEALVESVTRIAVR